MANREYESERRYGRGFWDRERERWEPRGRDYDRERGEREFWDRDREDWNRGDRQYGQAEYTGSESERYRGGRGGAPYWGGSYPGQGSRGSGYGPQSGSGPGGYESGGPETSRGQREYGREGRNWEEDRGFEDRSWGEAGRTGWRPGANQGYGMEPGDWNRERDDSWRQQGSYYGQGSSTESFGQGARHGRGATGWGGASGQYGQTGQYMGGIGTYGTSGGRHAGRGPKNYRRSDDRVREDVNQRLTDHPDVDATEIDVQVKECVVTLTGTVDDRRMRRLAEEIIENIPGVKDVQNQLRVESQTEITGPTTGVAAGTSSTERRK